MGRKTIKRTRRTAKPNNESNKEEPYDERYEFPFEVTKSEHREYPRGTILGFYIGKAKYGQEGFICIDCWEPIEKFIKAAGIKLPLRQTAKVSQEIARRPTGSCVICHCWFEVHRQDEDL